MKHARVIGAGLSGLASAWWLAERGYAVEVLERAPRPGGLIHTDVAADGLVERGANAFIWTPEVAEWFERLDLTPRFASAGSRARYVFSNGRPRRWPLSASSTITMMARLAARWTTRAVRPRETETLSGWSDRVLGAAATRLLIEPAFQGVYATRADRLSARIVLGQRRRGARRLVAPADGMGEFIRRLHDRLTKRGVSFRFDQPVAALEPGIVTVVSTGARAAATLVSPHAPTLGTAISRVSTTSVLTVTAFFDRHPADIKGFGVLFPRRQNVRALGVLFNADIFQGRSVVRSETWIYDVPSDHTAAESDRVSEGNARSLTERDRAVLTGRSDISRSVQARLWTDALPVYDDAVRDVVAATATAPGWLRLAGNYLGRLGVSGLLEIARERTADL